MRFIVLLVFSLCSLYCYSKQSILLDKCSETVQLAVLELKLDENNSRRENSSPIINYVKCERVDNDIVVRFVFAEGAADGEYYFRYSINRELLEKWSIGGAWSKDW